MTRTRFRLPTEGEIEAAVRDVAATLGRPTPLDAGASFPSAPGGTHLKRDDLLPTNSFKARAAIAVLADAARSGDDFLVVASSGNFGLAIASLASQYDIRVAVVLANDSSHGARAAIVETGAKLIVTGAGYESAALAARWISESRGLRFVSPDNDPIVIAGGASLIVELCQQIPRSRFTVYTPFVGGGSLAGMRLGFRVMGETHRVHLNGVYATVDATSYRCGIEGRQVWVPRAQRSLTDSFSGDVEPDSPAFRQLQEGYFRMTPVTVRDIEDAALELYENLGLQAEGTAAAAYACARQQWLHSEGHVAVVSGGNVDPKVFEADLSKARQRAAKGVVPSWTQDYQYRQTPEYAAALPRKMCG